jgi:hypothetical protein
MAIAGVCYRIRKPRSAMNAAAGIGLSKGVALAVLLAVSACSNNRPGPESTALPSVDQVLQHFVDSIGGEKAIMKPRSMTLRSDSTIYASHQRHIRVAVTVYLGVFKRVQVARVGRLTYLSGYDGNIGWSVAPGAKPQIVRGHNAVSIRRDADMYYWAHVQKYFKSMKVVGIDNFAGRRCYHLRGTTLWDNENNQYYDVKDGSLAGFRFHQWINGAPEKAESRQVFERYKSFGGLSFATRETDFRNDKLVATSRLNSVTYDNVNPQVFIPPPSVRRLER